MSINPQSFFAEIHELTEFVKAHRGRAFKGWPDETIFFYIAYHKLAGTLFVFNDKDCISGLGVAWIAHVENIGQPFVWRLPEKGDCMMICELVGTRTAMKTVYQMARSKWQDVKRHFTYRRGELVELTPRVMGRFLQ